MTDIYGNCPINGKDDGRGEEDSHFMGAIKDLETWKTKAEKADDVKARLILEKLEEDDAKTKAQQEMVVCVEKQEECQKEFTQSINALQEEILKLGKRRQDLLDKLKNHQAELESKRAESIKLKQKFKAWLRANNDHSAKSRPFSVLVPQWWNELLGQQESLAIFRKRLKTLDFTLTLHRKKRICTIYVQIPDTEVKFWGQIKDEREDDSQLIRGVFSISQRPTVVLQGGQALITFEEERVASQMLKIPKCSVSCDNSCLDTKPKIITMDPAVKFEVYLDVSRKKLKVSNIPSTMSLERMADRLEMSFSKPSRGGGEVDCVEYDKNTGKGQITFLQPGVAESLALRGKYRVDLDSEVNVQVETIYKYQLCKFQTFSGSPKRSILLDDIEDIEDEEDLQDHLEIHFQKPSNYGGEIECIKYISKGKALQAFFSL